MGYLGSKAASGTFQAIIAVMPPHDTYVELFAGSGAVLLRKPPAARSYAVDLDPRPLAAIHIARPDVECCATDAFDFLDGFDYAAAGRTLIYADLPRATHADALPPLDAALAARTGSQFTCDVHTGLIPALAIGTLYRDG